MSIDSIIDDLISIVDGTKSIHQGDLTQIEDIKRKEILVDLRYALSDPRFSPISVDMCKGFLDITFEEILSVVLNESDNNSLFGNDVRVLNESFYNLYSSYLDRIPSISSFKYI